MFRPLGARGAYRAWRVIKEGWFRKGEEERLHSVAMRDYIWHPDKPALGDVRTHGIYSGRNPVQARIWL